MSGHCPPQNQFQLSGNETQRQTEFLGVLAASQVDVTTLEEPVQTLCEERSVHWTRRVEGERCQFVQTLYGGRISSADNL